jgi:hypothetical protein
MDSSLVSYSGRSVSSWLGSWMCGWWIFGWQVTEVSACHSLLMNDSMRDPPSSTDRKLAVPSSPVMHFAVTDLSRMCRNSGS